MSIKKGTLLRSLLLVPGITCSYSLLFIISDNNHIANNLPKMINIIAMIGIIISISSPFLIDLF